MRILYIYFFLYFNTIYSFKFSQKRYRNYNFNYLYLKKRIKKPFIVQKNKPNKNETFINKEFNDKK